MKKWLATPLLITMKILIKKTLQQYFEERMDIPAKLRSYIFPLIANVYWFLVFHLPGGSLYNINWLTKVVLDC